MKQPALPQGIRLASGTDRATLGNVLDPAIPRGAIIAITGPMASGKSRLARFIIGSHFKVIPPAMPLPVPHPRTRTVDEKAIAEIMASTKPSFFDDVRGMIFGGKLGRGRMKEMPIDSDAMLAAVRTGHLIVLVGEHFDLSPRLEEWAIRIRLGDPRVK